MPFTTLQSFSLLAVMCSALLAAWPAAARAGEGRGALSIVPTDPPSLSILIQHGIYDFNKSALSIPDTTLTFQPPESRKGSVKAKTPGNFDTFYDSWEPWPEAPKGRPANFIALSPRQDEKGILMLGGLYRSFIADSVVVTNADASKTFTAGVDYKYNPQWGQIANWNGKLGTPGQGEVHVKFEYNTQRIDLVQIDAAGKITVKRGTPALTCPMLPDADAGQKQLAGIYIAPWKQPLAYVIAPMDIDPVNPAPPVSPVNPAALAEARKKLEAGGDLKIAFLGDSISLGAESGAWWNNLWTEKNPGFPSRVVVALRKKYPHATVTPIAAFNGGITTQGAIALFEKDVLPQKPDLVIIELGTNDAGGPVNGKAKNPPEKYKQDMLAFIQKSKAAGAEVLLVSPMAVNPFLMSHAAERIPAYNKVLRDLSKSENVGLADTYTAWQNQATHGVPPFSQLHNWINHPGPRGHKLYADVILRFFE